MTQGALSAQVKMSLENLNFCLSMLDNPPNPLHGPAASPHPSSAATKATKLCGSGWKKLLGDVRTPLDRHTPAAPSTVSLHKPLG